MRIRSSSAAAIAAIAAALLAGVALVVPSCASGAPSSARASAAAGDGADDSRNGRVFGEFEDARLFEDACESNPAMKDWTEREVRDGLSGATLQAKSFGGKMPDRVVLSDGKVVAYADGYGQFWVSLPPGVHELVGRCRGYRDSKVSVDVAPLSTSYVNFYLERR